MSSSETTKAGPPQAGSATKIAALTKGQHRQDIRPGQAVVAYALLLLAMPGAAFDRLLVRNCPICRAYAHVHHIPIGGARSSPIIRAPRCAPHRRYTIEITAVMPAAAVPGLRRRGAA